MPISTTRSGTDGCRTPAAIISSGSRGTASMASVARISTASVAPPANPAMPPMAMPERARDRRRQQADRERHPCAVQDAGEHIASEVVRAKAMGGRRRFAAMGEVELIRRVGRERGRGQRRRDQAHEQQRRRPHYASTTRGSISACAASATTLNTTIAVDVSINSAIRTE